MIEKIEKKMFLLGGVCKMSKVNVMIIGGKIKVVEVKEKKVFIDVKVLKEKVE